MNKETANKIFQLINYRIGIMSDGIENPRKLLYIKELDKDRAEVTWTRPETCGHPKECPHVHTDIYEIRNGKASVNGKDPFEMLKWILKSEQIEKWFYNEATKPA